MSKLENNRGQQDESQDIEDIVRDIGTNIIEAEDEYFKNEGI